MNGYLPFFKYELQINDKGVRYKAVSMFGKLFSMGPINLAVREPEIWKLYLQRFYDRHARVRKVCVQSSGGIVAQWPQLFDDLMAHIAEIQGDTSSIIRFEPSDFSLVDNNGCGRTSFLDDGVLLSLVEENRRKTVRELAEKLTISKLAITDHLNVSGKVKKTLKLGLLMH
ncbi:unnamed protein product [Nezara viridula]|uniref:Uncharacterized protein n=1 Tax=Nezara viridula TaxID=85310 RepID=A0A9P0E8M2_NEZVI|nr:unnamed protein product [Nezara viridula]